MVGELEVPEIDAEPGPDARNDRHDIDAAAGKDRHSEAGDDIGRSVDPEIALIEGIDRRQVVDQHHGAVALGAEIDAEGRPLPVNPVLAGVFGVEHALAIAHAADYRPAALLADDVAIGETVARHCPFDDAGEAL